MSNGKWSNSTFSDVCTALLTGGTPDTSIEKYWSGNIPWITGADFLHQKVTEPRRYITEEAVRQSNTVVIKGGSLLVVTRTGVGKVAIAPCDIAVSQDTTGIYFRSDVCIDFMFYYVQSRIDDLKKLNQGTSINGLLKEDLLALKIKIPHSYLEQEKIATILQTLDRAIAHTEALIEKYQQIKAGLMHDLFTRGIGADGKLRPTREQAPELYQESAIGWIPNDWISIKVDSLITGIDAGKSPECPDQPASADQSGVLKVSAVHPDGLKQTENKVITKTQYQNPGLLVKEGDLLITRANTPELVGMICYVEEIDGKLIISDKTLRLKINESRIDKRFLYWIFQHHKTRTQIEIDATGSSGSMKNISQRNIRNLDVAIPNSLDEQVMIRMRLDSIFNKVRKEIFTKSKLQKQKSGLMHDLLRVCKVVCVR